MIVVLFITFVIRSFCQIGDIQNCVVNKCVRTSVGTNCKKDQKCKQAVNDAFNKFSSESQNQENQDCYNKQSFEELMPCFQKIADQNAMQNEKFQQFVACGKQCLENPQMEKDKYYRRLISSANITKQSIILALVIVLFYFVL